jgi:hypothetical protein
MSNAITPSEQELKAARAVIGKCPFCDATPCGGEDECNSYAALCYWQRLGREVATHTRYEGKTADEIATMWVRELARAEAAEAQARLGWERAAEKDTAYQKALDRIAELEAVLVRCNTLGVVPPLSPDHESNALADYRRTVQVEALRWAAAHCGNMGSASVLRQYAAAVERGEVTLP